METNQFDRRSSGAIEIVRSRLKLLLEGDTEVIALIRSGLELQQSIDIDKKLEVLGFGILFSEELLKALLSGGEVFNLTAAMFIWEQLVANKLVTRLFSRPDLVMDHQLHRERIQRHIQNDTFFNLFTPPSALVTRYAGALVAIDVTKENGQTSRGSGFIVQFDQGAWIVTCKHNVDPADGVRDVEISDLKGSKIPVDRPQLSSCYDLAVYRLSEFSSPLFRLSSEGDIFDEVFTLGFPYVPGAGPMVVGHRGEVNGVADLFIGKMPALLISNLVSPGGSGCPVLVRDGHCIGMTVRWLEAEWNGEKARFSAALPAAKIAEFILSQG